MNYRHAFHAGNFVDVVKHIILCRLIDYLKRKSGAFHVLDTHAGIGRYSLKGPEAERSPEWRDGIGRVLSQGLSGTAAELAAPYIEMIEAMNTGPELTDYPGSPWLARQLLRPQDKLTACELHPKDAETLDALFARDRQVRVENMDGWNALSALLPPPEKRGLVLVDPPYEERDEFARMTQGLIRAHRRFATGIYALWYPIKDIEAVTDFARQLKSTGFPKILRIELTIRAPSTPPRLHGSGMIIINPPFVLEDELKILLPALADILADEGRGRWRLDWISGE